MRREMRRIPRLGEWTNFLAGSAPRQLTVRYDVLYEGTATKLTEVIILEVIITRSNHTMLIVFTTNKNTRHDLRTSRRPRNLAYADTL